MAAKQAKSINVSNLKAETATRQDVFEIAMKPRRRFAHNRRFFLGGGPIPDSESSLERKTTHAVE
jgi:hypothetical protein